MKPLHMYTDVHRFYLTMRSQFSETQQNNKKDIHGYHAFIIMFNTNKTIQNI